MGSLQQLKSDRPFLSHRPGLENSGGSKPDVGKGRGKISDHVKSLHGPSQETGISTDSGRFSDKREKIMTTVVASKEQNDDEQFNSSYSNVQPDACEENQSKLPQVQDLTKPRETYVPEPLPEGDAALEYRARNNYQVGVNFRALESIRVEIYGDRVQRCDGESFEDLNLDPVILQNLKEAGYKTPTPIQLNAIPYISIGRDVMACAQTGSGKSAAYLLPIITNLIKNKVSTKGVIRCLILSPTRELVAQINREANIYCRNTKVRVRHICGGVAFWYQKTMLKRGLDILIATPGRLLNMIAEDHINLTGVKYFVLDEADRMLDMGFMGQIERIMRNLPAKKERVNIMISATFPTQVQKAASDLLTNGIFVAIGTVGGASDNIEQIVYQVESVDKRRKLTEILKGVGPEEKIIIFCSRKPNADALATYLTALDFPSTSIHADRLQSQRDQALREFVEGKYQIVVATDVAARGLDIPNVAMVINYDLPETIEEYVQRIGRTGRVGHIGKAISFFETGYDDGLRQKLKSILYDAGQVVPEWLDYVDSEEEEDNSRGYRRSLAGYRRQGSISRCVPLAVEPDHGEW